MPASGKPEVTRVRLIDIANKVGVSKAIVSKVLSGTPARIGEPKRALIKELALKLGYTANPVARILAGKASRTVGVILDVDSPIEHFLRVACVQRELEKRGYMLVVGTCRPTVENISKFLEEFASRGGDGLISMAHVYPRICEEVTTLASSLFQHVVIYDAPPQLLNRNLNTVYIDFAAAARQAVLHLHGRGRRRISYFSPFYNEEVGPFHYGTERERGFLEGLEACGLQGSCEFGHLHNLFGGAGGYEAYSLVIKQFIEEERPDGVVCSNDQLGAMFIRHCTLNGIKVPDDIAVTGFDNLDFSGFTVPSLTTFDQRPEESAKAVVGRMMAMLEGGGSPAVDDVAIVPEMIVREST